MKRFQNKPGRYIQAKKYKMKLLLMLIVLVCSVSCFAQSNTSWEGKKCAVVLTYDDAIDQHLNNAVPLLDSLGLKATFYITAFSSSIKDRLNDWKKIAVNGHELGNHTLYHPCAGGKGREWVKPDYDMN